MIILTLKHAQAEMKTPCSVQTQPSRHHGCYLCVITGAAILYVVHFALIFGVCVFVCMQRERESRKQPTMQKLLEVG